MASEYDSVSDSVEEDLLDDGSVDEGDEAAEAAPAVPRNPVTLTGAQKRTLRALGHHLVAVVQIGKHGITDTLVAATREVLERHELIKISINGECPVDRKEVPGALAGQTGAHVAQIIGRTALLYRRRLEAPEVALPGKIDELPRPKPVAAKGSDAPRSGRKSGGSGQGMPTPASRKALAARNKAIAARSASASRPKKRK